MSSLHGPPRHLCARRRMMRTASDVVRASEIVLVAGKSVKEVVEIVFVVEESGVVVVVLGPREIVMVMVTIFTISENEGTADDVGIENVAVDVVDVYPGENNEVVGIVEVELEMIDIEGEVEAEEAVCVGEMPDDSVEAKKLVLMLCVVVALALRDGGGT